MAKPAPRLVWLREALPILRSLVSEHATIVHRIQVRPAFTGAGPLRKNSLGTTANLDRRAVIELSCNVRSARLALAVLLHELVHLTQPEFSHEHGPEFRRIARRVGFVSPFREIRTGRRLEAQLRAISRELGPYPPAQNGGRRASR